jgi:hypothetical protein
LTAPLLWTQLRIRANNWHQRRAAGTFAIGYCSHLATDVVGPLVSRDLDRLTYFAYPLVAAPPKGPNAGFFTLPWR